MLLDHAVERADNLAGKVLSDFPSLELLVEGVGKSFADAMIWMLVKTDC